MTLPNPRGWMGVFFILVCLAIPFGIIYYVSTPNYKAKYQGWIKSSREAGVPSFSRVSDTQVMLVKDDRVTLGKTSLVFRGVRDNQVHIDLYLLELDSVRPYPMHFSKNSTDKIIRLGDISFTLQSVRGKVLTMKINGMSRTD